MGLRLCCDWAVYVAALRMPQLIAVTTMMFSPAGRPDMTLAQTSHTCARDAEKVLSCCLVLRSVHTSCCDDMAGNTTATTRLGPSIQSAGSLGHAMASERGATPERTWSRHCGPWRLDIAGTRRPRMLRGGLVAAGLVVPTLRQNSRVFGGCNAQADDVGRAQCKDAVAPDSQQQQRTVHGEH